MYLKSNFALLFPLQKRAFLGYQRAIKIVKIKTDSGLFIEIYDLSKEHVSPLVDRIHLPDEKDGYYV
ncbi:MAG: hypothetical protein R2827_01330 [Bdellovibrionales bacterium]